MNHAWSVFARDEATERNWIQQIKAFQRSAGGALGNGVVSGNEKVNSVVLFDAERNDWREIAQGTSRENRYFILVLEESSFLPQSKDLEWVDDVMVFPFRMVELLSHFRRGHQEQFHAEVISEIDRTQQALAQANETVERILKSKTPKRFSGIRGVSIMSRHLSGLKPGGDYFDVFEPEGKEWINFLMADSSSYGLSSALLGLILASSAKIAGEAQLSSSRWIKAIFSEIKLTMGEQEHLSIFYGRMNRFDYTLHYQLFGSIEAFAVDRDGQSKRLAKQGDRLAKEFEGSDEEGMVKLSPKDRLVLLSDGFVGGTGGIDELTEIFEAKRAQDPFTLVNELAFQIKSKLTPGETFPGEDCSAIVIDIEQRSLRLAPVG